MSDAFPPCTLEPVPSFAATPSSHEVANQRNSYPIIGSENFTSLCNAQYLAVQEKVVADQPNQRPVLKVELEENYPIVLYRGGKAPASPSLSSDTRTASSTTFS